MLHILLLQWIVIHLCIVGISSQTVIRGVVGQAITLPCTYSVRRASDRTAMCWGQGNCPNSRCGNEILQTNGWRVTSRRSNRYQLRGYLTRGDVSLTILDLKEGDKGVYCCRIEIRGWFNDIKRNLYLQVDRATTTTHSPTTSTRRQRIAATSTTTPLTTTVMLPTTPPFLITSTLASSSVPTAVPLTTEVPVMATSCMSPAIPTMAPSLVKIHSSPTSLLDEQTENGCCFRTTETTPPTPAPTTDSPTAITTTPGRITTISTVSPLTTTVTTTTDSLTTVTTMTTTTMTTSSRITIKSTVAPLTISVIPPTSPPFLLITNSASLTTTNAPAVGTPSMSTAIALSTTAPSSVIIKSSPSSLQEELTENGHCFLTSDTTPPTTDHKLVVSRLKTSGAAPSHQQGENRNATLYSKPQNVKMSKPNVILYAIVLPIVFLMLLAVLVIVKCKKMKTHHLGKMYSLNRQEESEEMLTGTEGEHGLFTL